MCSLVWDCGILNIKTAEKREREREREREIAIKIDTVDREI